MKVDRKEEKFLNNEGVMKEEKVYQLKELWKENNWFIPFCPAFSRKLEIYWLALMRNARKHRIFPSIVWRYTLGLRPMTIGNICLKRSFLPENWPESLISWCLEPHLRYAYSCKYGKEAFKCRLYKEVGKRRRRMIASGLAGGYAQGAYRNCSSGWGGEYRLMKIGLKGVCG